MASKAPAAQLRVKYEAFIWFQDGMFLAAAQPLDVASGGQTEDEALRNLEEAVLLFLETTRDHGTLLTIFEETGYKRVGDTWEAPERHIRKQVAELPAYRPFCGRLIGEYKIRSSSPMASFSKGKEAITAFTGRREFSVR